MNTEPPLRVRWAPFFQRYARYFNAAPEKKRLLREGACVAGGQIVSALGQLVGIRLLTEFVSPKIFGIVSLLLGVGTLVSNTFCAPLLHAALRFHPDCVRTHHLGTLRRTLVRELGRGVLLALGLVLLGGAVCRLSADISYWAFVLLAGLLLFEVARTLETNLLTAARRQLPFALWGAAEAWARPMLAVAAVLLLGVTPRAVLGGYLAATAVVFGLFRFSVRREGVRGKDKPESFAPDLKRQLWHYALPLVPLALVTWVASLSDRYIIGGLLGLEQVGIYAAAYGLISRPFLMAGGMIGVTLRPVYFEAVSCGNRPLEHKVLRLWLGLTVSVGLGGVLAAWLCAGWITHILLAERYRSAAILMPWIACGYFVFVLSHIYHTVCLAYKKTWYVFSSEAAAGVSSILFTIPLTYFYGLEGAAWSVPLYFFFQLALGWALARQIQTNQAACGNGRADGGFF